MNSWSKRRKLLYAIVVVATAIALIGLPAFYHFYKAPTCFDGKQNNGELGIDCGGSCARLCPSAYLPPSASWTRFEELSPGFYNVAAYIINPNTDAGAYNVPYHIVIYDDKGILIADVPGRITIPPHRNTLAFQSGVSTGKRIPFRAIFEFTAYPDWRKQKDSLSALEIGDKDYNDDETGSSLSVTLRNSSALPITNLSVYAVLKDKNQNTLGFSKTFVDAVPPHGSAVAPFTWPTSRGGNVISIEVLPVAE
jgi:hypothetical protein